MKKIFFALTTALLFSNFSFAQDLNWKTFGENQKHLGYVNLGYDYGLTVQIGYGYKINVIKPILLTLDYSLPMGEDLLDDFKIRYGGQVEVFEINNFMMTTKLYGNFRRHENNLVRMASFGTELAGILGYYKQTWHIAGEFGFDKSIITHLKHAELMRDNNPDIVDGWLIPSGGNYFYGLQVGKTIGSKSQISLRLGATNAQGKHENAILPYYASLGYVYKFSSEP